VRVRRKSAKSHSRFASKISPWYIDICQYIILHETSAREPNQVGGNQLWKNQGGRKFKNITQEAGVGLPDRISVAAAFADIDNDGDQDLFVTTVRGGNVLFQNDGHGHFRDISQESGLDLAVRAGLLTKGSAEPPALHAAIAV
jgi:hypothetical protein